ncbi:MAG: galactokinase [Actinomycetota bacterium]|nr:galactokinase [Actinomycetota bacterium]
MTERRRFRATAPGRVNLIGDHTDYMGGLAMPMAVQLATTVEGTRRDGVISLRSEDVDGTVELELPIRDAAAVTPTWGRYVAGVAAEVGRLDGLAGVGLDAAVRSTIPLGSGLSSSAALEVAVAMALGDPGTPLEVARRCQRAEQLATGVPCGIMDQLASAAGVDGAALLMDCATDRVVPVTVPTDAWFHVLHSGQQRELAGSEYATRRAQCERAAALVGPLPVADDAAIERIDDRVVRARARHVRSECRRVEVFAAALVDGDLTTAGAAMNESHRSLRDDFEVSTPALDALVARLLATDGVLGARLTGAGFGGCVVALTRPGVELDGWRVLPGPGARLEWLDDE